jgi:O-antigen/teichoic acid export membrane protein
MRLFREYTASSVIVLAAHVLARGGVTLAAIVVARFFSAPEFSAYSYFQIAISSLATFASFGLGTSATRYFSAVTGNDGGDEFPLGTLWLCGLLASLGAALLVLALPQEWVGIDTSLPRYAMAAGVFAILLTIVPAGAMTGLQMYVQSVATSLVSATVLFVVIAFAVAKNSVVFAVAALVSSFLAQAIADSVCVIRRVGFRLLIATARLNRRALSQLLGFAGPMFLVSVLNAVSLWGIARIVRSSDGSQVAFALFSIGMQWFSLVLVIPAVLTKISVPLLVRAHQDSSQIRVARMGIALAVCTSGLGVVAVLIGLPILEDLYGRNYEISWLVILPFLAAALFNAPAGVAGNIIVVSGRQWMWLLITLLATCAGLVVSWVSKGLGALGGGVAVFINSLLLAVFGYLYMSTHTSRGSDSVAKS